jgi:hypothetical protein
MHPRTLQYDDDKTESAFSLYSTGKSGIEKYSKPGVDGYLVQLNALLCPLILERQKEIIFSRPNPGPRTNRLLPAGRCELEVEASPASSDRLPRPAKLTNLPSPLPFHPAMVTARDRCAGRMA